MSRPQESIGELNGLSILQFPLISAFTAICEINRSIENAALLLLDQRPRLGIKQQEKVNKPQLVIQTSL